MKIWWKCDLIMCVQCMYRICTEPKKSPRSSFIMLIDHLFITPDEHASTMDWKALEKQIQISSCSSCSQVAATSCEVQSSLGADYHPSNSPLHPSSIPWTLLCARDTAVSKTRPWLPEVYVVSGRWHRMMLLPMAWWWEPSCLCQDLGDVGMWARQTYSLWVEEKQTGASLACLSSRKEARVLTVSERVGG